MHCEEVAANEIVEKYLQGGLSDDIRDAFEQHYFECERCFGQLQTYRALQAELARTSAVVRADAPKYAWLSRWAWVPTAAVLFIVASIVLWQRPYPSEPGPEAGDQPRPPAAAGPSAQNETSPPPLVSSQALLTELARVEAPPYVSSRLRGTPDEAAKLFQAAMKLYGDAQYAKAVEGLEAAAALDPNAPHIAFFLGISQLLSARPDAAITALNKTVALGDSAYREDAHFYLAKAHLQTGRVDRAIEESKNTVGLRGEREAEARQILQRLQQIQDRQ